MGNYSQFVYTGLISAGMVPLISLLKREHWSQQLKFAIAVIASFAAASIEVAVDHHVTNLHQFISLVGLAIATTQVVYQFYFSGSDFENVITRTAPPAPVVPAPDPNVTNVSPTSTTAPAPTVAPVPQPITDISVSAPDPTPVVTGHDGGTVLSDPTAATPTTAPIPTPITGRRT